MPSSTAALWRRGLKKHYNSSERCCVSRFHIHFFSFPSPVFFFICCPCRSLRGVFCPLILSLISLNLHLHFGSIQHSTKLTLTLIVFAYGLYTQISCFLINEPVKRLQQIFFGGGGSLHLWAVKSNSSITLARLSRKNFVCMCVCVYARAHIRDVTHTVPVNIRAIWWFSSQECDDCIQLMLSCAY